MNATTYTINDTDTAPRVIATNVLASDVGATLWDYFAAFDAHMDVLIDMRALGRDLVAGKLDDARKLADRWNVSIQRED